MPIDPITGLLVGASLATSAGSSFAQGAMNKKQRQWASEEAEKAYQRNIEQWMRENEYNDPSNQLARMKAAGLNPNMIYGSGKSAALSASSPQKEAPKGQFINPMEQVGAGQIASASIAMQQARSIQLDNMMKEYDLGLRDPKYHSTTIQSLNPQTNEWEVHILKDTKNMYYKRLKYKTEIQWNKKKEANLAGLLADQGFTTRDPKVLRMIATALEAENIDFNKVSRDVIMSILNKLGFN